MKENPRTVSILTRSGEVVGEGVAGLFVQQATTKQPLPPESDHSGLHDARRHLVRIEEVVLEIPHGRPVGAAESALLRAFASSCVIGLGGTGSAV